jgi:hypothetical protein
MPTALGGHVFRTAHAHAKPWAWHPLSLDVVLGRELLHPGSRRGARTKIESQPMTCCRSFAFVVILVGGSVGPAADGAAGGAVRRETIPPLLSLYLPISLGVPNVQDQSTGVFVPAGYRAGREVDLLVFLRGYDIKRPKAGTSVEEYWNSPRHPVLKSFLFRDEVNKSGKNIVLVVPPLGPFSEAGKLAEAGGPQEFLGQILDGLWKHGPHAGPAERPKLRHLILAAHSGGGVPLRRIAQILGDDPAYKDTLKECWGFDSIYGVKDRDADFWADFARAHLGTKITMFYIATEKAVGKDPKRPVGPDNPVDHREPTGTTRPATDLNRLAGERKLRNVAVIRETMVRHNEVPLAHLADLLRAAACLDPR